MARNKRYLTSDVCFVWFEMGLILLVIHLFHVTLYPTSYVLITRALQPTQEEAALLAKLPSFTLDVCPGPDALACY
jgi:hypothetical protein